MTPDLDKIFDMIFETPTQEEVIAAFLKHSGLYLSGHEIYSIDGNEYYGVVTDVKADYGTLMVKIRRATAIYDCKVSIKV